MARVDDRILLTFDKDFGDLVLRRGLPASRGVVLFRMPLEDPGRIARLVVSVLASRTDWADHFSVVESERVRMRPLAGGKAPA